MVSSLDCMIAKEDNSVSWFDTTDLYEKGMPVPEGFPEVDCFVMGSRTYEHALELSKEYGWVYGDVPTVVTTARKLPVERPSVELYAGGLPELVNGRLRPNYKNVWLVGGAALTKAFLRLELAHEIRMTILPIILGGGVTFFDHIGREQQLHLKDATAFKNGMVELWYELIHENSKSVS